MVAYVMGGDPDLISSQEVMEAVILGGADILEVGIPFSDPIADGKSVQAAGVRALRSGTRPTDVLRLVAKVRKRSDVPIALMTYYNPVFARGVGEFLDASKKCGVDGIIVPDLPLDEAGAFGRAARRRGIDSILLATPTTSPERMKTIVASTCGFLYLVSLLGVTGARAELKESTVKLVRFARQFTEGKIPLAVGFGISKPDHVRAVIGAGADAAIVGSAIVDRVGEFATGEHGSAKVIEEYVRSLKQATR
ncbi:MAG: tryptophan synthase subunit alpha [Thaumarchaeota archaeon]|nr:tryptophan synthase subunit alpha [Nitrososphaerota archaeon]